MGRSPAAFRNGLQYTWRHTDPFFNRYRVLASHITTNTQQPENPTTSWFSNFLFFKSKRPKGTNRLFPEGIPEWMEKNTQKPGAKNEKKSGDEKDKNNDYKEDKKSPNE